MEDRHVSWNVRWYDEYGGYLPDPLPESLAKEKSYLKSSVMHRPIEQLPGLFASSIPYCNMVDELVDVLNDELPPDEWLGQGFASTGVASTWHDCRQIMGYAGIPYGTPPREADKYRLEVLRSSSKQMHHDFAQNPVLSSEELNFQDTCFDVMTGVSDEEFNIPVKQVANSGFWEYKANIEATKTAQIIDVWNKKPGAWIKYIGSGDYLALANECSPLLYGVAYRFQLNGFIQTDSGLWIPKPRSSFDFNGNWVDINFTPPDNLNFHKKFSLCRPRVVNMGSYAMYPLRIAAKMIQLYMKTEFKFTYLHTSPEDIEKKTEGATSIEIYDVKNHDWSGTKEMLDSFAKAMRKYFNPWVVDLFIDSCMAADAVKSDTPGKPGFIFRGSIKNRKSLEDHLGNRSGNPLTSEIAKQWGTFYGLWGLWKRGDIKHDSTEISLVLRGLHPKVRMLNAGDNIIIVNLIGQDRPISEFVNIAVLDTTKSFLGWTPHVTQNRIVWKPSVNTAVRNLIHKDKSVGSVHAPYWGHGVLTRRDYFRGNDAAEHALKIVDKISAKHFGMSFTDFAKRHYIDPNVNFSNLNEDEKLFLFDSDYIHYRISQENIRPELFERTYSTYFFKDFANLRNEMIA
jgi:hypothetical protein